MKKILLSFLLLLPLLSCGEEALYPARVADKWGYINQAGEMVITPQWQAVGLFSNGFALVEGEGGQGVIDSRGNVVLPPIYDITPHPYVYSIWGADPSGNPKLAYFDPAGGYLSPLIYDFIDDSFRDDPAAPMAVWTDEPPRLTYIIPATGEKAFENEYDALYDHAAFREGYALASNEWIQYDEDGNACGWGPEFHLIDYHGKETLFPEGISPDSQVQEGYLRISRNLTNEERAARDSGWGVVYGLAKPTGEIIIAPQYDYLYPPVEGCVTIWQDQLLGHIDLETGQAVEPRFYISTGGPLPYYSFSNGYALLDDVMLEEGTPWWAEHEWGQKLIDRQGNVILSLGKEDDYSLATRVFTPDGLCVYKKNQKYGLMKIADGQASFLTEAVYEKINIWDDLTDIKNPLDTGGLPAKMDGRWGYLNGQAEWMIPPQWEKADLFRQGLAQVEKDGKMAYINLQGDIIWQQP